MNLFRELRRRNVYKVAVTYAVVAWLLVQIATQTFPFFERAGLGDPPRHPSAGARLSSGVGDRMGV